MLKRLRTAHSASLGRMTLVCRPLTARLWYLSRRRRLSPLAITSRAQSYRYLHGEKKEVRTLWQCFYNRWLGWPSFYVRPFVASGDDGGSRTTASRQRHGGLDRSKYDHRVPYGLDSRSFLAHIQRRHRDCFVRLDIFPLNNSFYLLSLRATIVNCVGADYIIKPSMSLVRSFIKKT